MKIKKVLALVVITVAILAITSISSLAATFNLDVTFDGKTMKLTSDDLALNTINLLPGETDTSTITIENKGTKKVQLYVTAKIVDDQSLLNILDITATNSANKEIFKGDYSEFKKVEISLEKGEKETITIKTTMPKTAGNEYQDKEANIKFTFEANGEEIPVAPKTNQSRVIIYTVLSGIVVILIITLIVLTISKKRKENNK